MKLSTKGQYGVRAMYELARHFGYGPLSLKQISQNQEISESYLEQLVAPLRKAGLVRSIRGAQGGYILSKEPKAITVGDVIRVLEGPIAPVECVNAHSPDDCRRSSTCVAKGVWKKVRDSIEGVLDSITLEQLCHEAEHIRQNTIPGGAKQP